MNRKQRQRHGLRVVAKTSLDAAKAKATATGTPNAKSAEAANEEPLEMETDLALLGLHVVRIIALYVYVLLSKHAFAVEDFFQHPEASARTSSQLEHQIYATLVACVRGEIDSNQFDGLVQEQHVFAVLKRTFRLQRMRVHTQCRVLLRILDQQLRQLEDNPIVQCDHASVLASTLEYLAQERNAGSVSASLLYPLVNVVDSLSIEQRECLDALTILWNWMGKCDPSGMIVESLVRLYHASVFRVRNASNACLSSSSSGDKNQQSSSTDLAICFVRTLVLHSDHIFRRDVSWRNAQPMWDSGSEDELDDPSDVSTASSSDADSISKNHQRLSNTTTSPTLLPPLTKQCCIPETASNETKQKSESLAPAAVCMGIVAAAVATLWRIFT